MKKLLLISIILGGFAGIKADEKGPEQKVNWKPLQESSCKVDTDCANAFSIASKNFWQHVKYSPNEITPNNYRCLNKVCQVGWSRRFQKSNL